MFLSYFWPWVFLRLGVIESRALQPTKSECIAGRQLSWVSWFSERKKAEANAPAQIWLPSSGGSSAMTQWGGLLIFSCSSLPFPPCADLARLYIWSHPSVSLSSLAAHLRRNELITGTRCFLCSAQDEPFFLPSFLLPLQTRCPAIAVPRNLPVSLSQRSQPGILLVAPASSVQFSRSGLFSYGLPVPSLGEYEDAE